MYKRYAIPVYFIVEATNHVAAKNILRDHLNITLASEYEDIGVAQELKDTAETRSFPLTSGVVPLRPLPAVVSLGDLGEPHFEGSRFEHDEFPYT